VHFVSPYFLILFFYFNFNLTAPINLGTAQYFALYGSGVYVSLNEAVSVTVRGSIGSTLGPVETGKNEVGSSFGPASGSHVYLGQAATAQLRADIATALDDCLTREGGVLMGSLVPPQTDDFYYSYSNLDSIIISNDLTLYPGIYTTDNKELVLKDGVTLTLDGRGDANAMWIFQCTTAGLSISGAVIKIVNLPGYKVNGNSSVPVWWAIGGEDNYLTIGSASTVFVGNVLTSSGVSIESPASIRGSILALASIYMDATNVKLQSFTYPNTFIAAASTGSFYLFISCFVSSLLCGVFIA
jgi:hypothetical protein